MSLDRWEDNYDAGERVESSFLQPEAIRGSGIKRFDQAAEAIQYAIETAPQRVGPGSDALQQLCGSDYRVRRLTGTAARGRNHWTFQASTMLLRIA